MAGARSRTRRSLAIVAGTAVVMSALTPVWASSARASGSTIRVTGTLLVSPAEDQGGGASYALALADGDLVPVRGDIGPSPEPGARITADLELPPGVDPGRSALARVDDRGATLVVRRIVRQEASQPAAAASAVHRVFVAAPSNLGTFPMTDAEILSLVRDAADYWEDESDGVVSDMPTPPAVKRYHATVATDGNNCGLSTGFFEVMEEAAQQFPGADFTGGPDHLLLLAPSLCNGGGTLGRGVLGDSLQDGGFQVTFVAGTQSVGTMAHEWGHNFGLMHANIGVCGDFCEREYENIYSVMGFGVGPDFNRLTALGTSFRSFLGLRADAEVHHVDAGDGTSVVTVARTLVPRSSETGLRAISVLDPDTGRRLYVDYRSGTLQDEGALYAQGVDAFGYRFEPGVVIEVLDDSAAALLPSGTSTSLASDTWTNGSGTMSIAAGALTASGVRVTVTYTPGEPWTTPLTASVSGEAAVNNWLSAETNAVRRAFQWLVDGDPVPNATERQFRPRPEDVGKTVAVAVTEYGYGKGMRTVTSAPVEIAPGTLSYYDKPYVSGVAEVGRTLTTGGAIWDSPDFDGPTATALQWRRDGTAITGATGSSYVVSAEDAGHRITVSDTGTREGYAPMTLTSAPTAPVPLPPLTGVPTPTIDGVPQVDATLTVDAGTWPDGTTLAFQWRANGSAIRGADGETYVPSPTDVGRRISVQVTGTKPGYQPAARTSTATAEVVRARLVAGDPTITGRARVGRTLRAVTGTWTEGTTFRYRWKAGGVNIRGATAPTLVLKARQRGKRITVVVTGSRSGYTTVSRTSPPTRRVRR